MVYAKIVFIGQDPNNYEEVNNLFNVGDLIDSKYKVISHIGQGGFGMVLEVYSLEKSKHFALKYCNTPDEEIMKRFKREVRLMEAIDHGNVIRVTDFNLEYEVPYFCMPLAKYSLKNVIPLDLPNCIDAFEQICNGVNAIHLSGSTHRDLKPDNILIMPDDTIVVSDLGLSKFDNRESTILTKTNMTIGTEAYMPPEQRLPGGTRDLQHSGDVYMLGKTLYEMITGKLPYPLNYGNLPIGLQMVIRKATQDNPDNRYQTVGNLLDAFLDSCKAMTEVDKDGFKSLVETATEKIKRGEPIDDISSTIIDNIIKQEDDEELIEYFHELTNELLRELVKEYKDAFLELLIKYQVAIESVVGGYSFSFAENVDERMKIVIASSESFEMKSKALVVILIAAVKLNRFAVMSSFNNILTSITDDEFASYVAEELRSHIEYYEAISDQVPRKELHKSIAVVWDRC